LATSRETLEVQTTLQAGAVPVLNLTLIVCRVDRPSEDYIATLNQLIMEARQLLGMAEKCDKCGETVPYVIGCPGGAEICQDCFDAGQN
jgi:hypothetical protein